MLNLAPTPKILKDYVTQNKCIADQHAEIASLRAAAQQARAALQMTTMLKRLGGMMPGSHEMVQLTVEEAEGALRALDAALKETP